MPRRDGLHCYVAAVAVFLLTCPAHSQENKFAGNLNPENNHAAEPSASNQTAPAEVVYALPLSNGAPTQEKADASPSPIPQERANAGQSIKKEPARRAPRPLGKPESVGFVPPPEDEEENVEVSEQVEEKHMVNLIPTLPASIIKPGRMSNASWYIVLYASWCVHSQAALTEFLQTIQYIVDHNMTEIVVGKIDIIKHNEVAKHFRVKSTPTIFFFKNGVRHTFDHPIVNTTNLVNFMLEILLASVPTLHNVSELAALKENHSVIFLIVHNEEIDQDWQHIFMKQANDKALKAKFAVTTNPDILEEHDFRTLPTILVLKDDIVIKFRGSLTSHALSKWILLEKDAAFPTVDRSTLRKYLHPVSGRRLAVLVVNQDPNQRTKVIEGIRILAQSREMHQKYQFLLMEGRSIPEILLRRSVGQFPFFFVFEPYTGYYYLFEPGGKRDSLSKNSISDFLHGVNSGEEERLGGVTYFDQIEHLYQLGYGMVQSMFVHRPILSMLAGFCMVCVVCFYIIVCWQSRTNRPSGAEIKSRKAARARRRKEELAKREEEATRRRIEAKEKAVTKSRDAIRLRKRDENDIQNAESDGGTESTSGDIQSDSDYDPQTKR